MSMAGWARTLPTVLVAGAVVAAAVPAEAVDARVFEPRFADRVAGDISVVTAYTTATTSRPAGSTLLFAGLYWGGRLPADPAMANRVTVRVGSATPAAVAADQLDIHPTGGFSAVADVTALLADAGPYVDLVVDDPGSEPWSLVTAWSSPAEPLRDLRIVDGLAGASATSSATVVVDGLSTPSRGPVAASVSVVAYGDDVRGRAQVEPGQSEARIPVIADGEALVAAVTTSTDAAAVTDLALTAQVDRVTAGVGDVVEFAITVRNHGPDDQTAPATVTIRSPDGVEPDPLSLEVIGGACGLNRNGTVCALNPLNAGDDARLSFTATVVARTGGALSTRARVFAATADTDPALANDTAPVHIRADRSPTPARPQTIPAESPARSGPPGDVGGSAQSPPTMTDHQNDRDRPQLPNGGQPPWVPPEGSTDHQQR